MRRLPILPLVAAALVAVAAPVAVGTPAAQAAFFPGDAIDGPSPDIQALGDLDLARDGTGGLTYVRTDGGVDHVFVSRFIGGVFQHPDRIDAALPGPSSKPVIGAADRGRLLIAFVNSGIVYGVLRAAGTYSRPIPLLAGDDPAADLSINGTGYVSVTSAAADIGLVRLDGRTKAFTLLPQALDIVPSRAAGLGTGRSKVAVSADGVALVVWGEEGHVFARKIFNTRISASPQDLTPPEFAGRGATTSDLPDVDVEDDSSFGWAVYRQTFGDGSTRILARRQRGTTFDPPVAVDPGDEAVDDPRIDLNGRGVGLATMAGLGTRQPMVDVLEKDAFGVGTRILGASVVGPAAVPAIAENNNGLVAAAVAGAGQAAFVRVRPFQHGQPRPEVVVSRPELGGVEPDLGFDAASDRAFGVVMAWLQGVPGDQRLVAGYFDRPPLRFRGLTPQRCCRSSAPLLTWQAAFDLWGKVRYQVFVDGKPVGRPTGFRRLKVPSRLARGTHRWWVVASDVRGQTQRTRTRLLRIGRRRAA
ncbi:MAG: hypothetical protein M3296_06000 [Actinomycetota bacterium]|nr:hypothetical protein [Actinomycetota bacterium]